MFGKNYRPPEAILRPYLFRKAITFMVGDPGIGKTTLNYTVARDLALGRDCLGITPEDGRKYGSLILDFESGPNLLAGKSNQYGDYPPCDMVGIMAGDLRLLSDLIKSGDLDTDYSRYGFDLLIIDNLGMAYSLRDENDNAEAEKHIKQLRGIAKQFDCAVLLVHHPSKAVDVTGTRKGSGAYAWSRYCDIHLNLNNVDPEHGKIQIEVAKNRQDENYHTRWIQKVGDCEFVECESPDGTMSTDTRTSDGNWPVQRAMRTILEISGTFTRAVAISTVKACHPDMNERTTVRALDKLLSTDRIHRTDRYGEYENRGHING